MASPFLTITNWCIIWRPYVAAASSGAIGFAFLGAWLEFSAAVHRPVSLSLVLVMAVAGTSIVLITVLGVMNKALAKYRLAIHVADFSPAEIGYLHGLIERASSPRLAPFYRELNANSSVDWTSWVKLTEFLETDPLGRLASDALHQRSRTGRLRYFSKVKYYASQLRDQRNLIFE